jgi:hypothetical protein
MFPRKSQEPNEAAQLDAVLRLSSYWDRVSCLDRGALTALWQQRENEAAELRAILEQYAWTEDQTTLSVRKRRT